MAYYQSRKQLLFSILYGQFLIFVLVIVNVFHPELYTFTFILFLISALIFTTVMMRKSKSVSKVPLSEIRSGRLLYKADPSEVSEIQRNDVELIKELKPMLRLSIMSLAMSLATLLLWYRIYFPYVNALLGESVNLTYKALMYLIGYEVPYILISLVNQLSRRSVKEFVQILNSYEVYDRGLVGSSIVLSFPLESSKYRVLLNSKRGYVDIIHKSGKTVLKYRLYSKNPERLFDVIKWYGKLTDYQIIK